MIKTALFALAVAVVWPQHANAQTKARAEPPGQAPKRTCLEYSPAPVFLIGHLERLTFPGGPNFRSISEGDESTTGLYLRLAHPICTSTSSTRAGVDEASLLRLKVDSAGAMSLRSVVDSEITVRGTLLPSINRRDPMQIELTPHLPVTLYRKP